MKSILLNNPLTRLPLDKIAAISIPQMIFSDAFS